MTFLLHVMGESLAIPIDGLWHRVFLMAFLSHYTSPLLPIMEENPLDNLHAFSLVTLDISKDLICEVSKVTKKYFDDLAPQE